MGKKYRNSDFKNDVFYKRPQFYERLRIARLADKETYFNEVRKINNSKEGRKYIGDVSIQDIFRDNWNNFLNKYETPDNPIRPSIKENVDNMINCQNPDNGVLFMFAQIVRILILSPKHVNQDFVLNVAKNIEGRLL